MFVFCAAGASGVAKNFELRNGQNCSEVSRTEYAKHAVRIVHHLNNYACILRDFNQVGVFYENVDQQFIRLVDTTNIA